MQDELELIKKEQEEFEEMAEADMGVASPPKIKSVELKFKGERIKRDLNGTKKRMQWARVFLLAYAVTFVIMLALAIYGIHNGFWIAVVITFILGMIWAVLPLENNGK